MNWYSARVEASRRLYLRRFCRLYPACCVRALAFLDEFAWGLAGWPIVIWWPSKRDRVALGEYRWEARQ